MITKMIACAVLLCTPAAAAGQQMPYVDSIVSALIEQRMVPGAAVAIVHDTTILHARGYGFANLQTRVHVTPQTIFQIASLTKPFTAIVIKRLIELGKLHEDDKASTYLSWLPSQYATLTIRQLLTHTSGISRDLRRANVDEFSEEEFRNRLRVSQPSFPPGTKWEYANTGYSVLSFVAEEVMGKSFSEILDSLIFTPLSMTRSRYRNPADGRDHAMGYDLVDGKPQAAPRVFSGWGNSGIESSIADLARFAIALNRHKLIKPANYAEMFAPASLSDGSQVSFPFRGETASYGMGWFVFPDASVRHGGAIAGFQSSFQKYPDGTTIIVLTNGKQGADGQGHAEVIGKAVEVAFRTR